MIDTGSLCSTSQRLDSRENIKKLQSIQSPLVRQTITDDTEAMSCVGEDLPDIGWRKTVMVSSTLGETDDLLYRVESSAVA